VPAGPAAGLRLGDQAASADYQHEANEVPVQEAIRDGLTPGAVFFDVGANVGFFSLMAARCVGPTGRVVAFEPIPTHAASIRSNAELNGLSIEVIEAAVGDRHGGRTRLWVSQHPGGSTISTTDVPPDVTGHIDVEQVTLDGLLDRGQLPVPSVMKIDVEGAELSVLQGAANLLSSHHPRVVVEVDDATDAGLRWKRDAIVRELEQHGYQIESLPPSYAGAWQVEHLLAVARDQPARPTPPPNLTNR
jgi:FkbM family methyltransferase